MLCQNCGKNEANVRYTQIINGVKKETILCEECSKKLGVGNIDFSMPISFSSFLGDFFDDEKEFLPSFMAPEKLVCDKCGMTYEDFINTGKFGCENCYEIFSNKIDSVLKNIHGLNRHVGRGIPDRLNRKTENKNETSAVKTSKEPLDEDNVTIQDNHLKQLKDDLKQAIQEERYEDAAKLRDEIKKLEK